MTAQVKAMQLVVDFMDLSDEQEYNTPRYMTKEMAIQCALIAVNELIKNVSDVNSRVWYWQEVKEEIEKI